MLLPKDSFVVYQPSLLFFSLKKTEMTKLVLRNFLYATTKILMGKKLCTLSKREPKETHMSKTNRQHHGQKEKDQQTNNSTQNTT